MKAITRIFSAVLSAAFVFNIAMPAAIQSAAAAENEEVSLSLSETIKNGLAEFSPYIDISGYALTSGDVQELNSAVNEALLEPDIFYVDIENVKCSAAAGEDGNIYLTAVKPIYNSDVDSAQTLINEFDAKVNEIISTTITDGMSDMEKALKLHDYIVLHSKYDLDNSIPDNNGGSSAYDVLVCNNGVCQGYAQAYKTLLNKVGIESVLATSESMVHAWNLVKIDNNWYHVDVTWDDPVPDTEGRVNHNYFMLSDSAISSESDVRTELHHDWNSRGIVADSTLYDNEFWNKVSSEIFIYNNKWYFISEDGKYSSYSSDTDSVSADINLEDEKWTVWGYSQQYWSGRYTSLIISGEKVYYNTPTMIYEMNLDGSCKTGLKYVNPYDNGGYMYGLVLKDDVLYAVIKTSPVEDGKLVPVMDLHLESYSYIQTLLKSISDMQDGDTSSFNMTQEKVLPAAALEIIKGKNVNVILELEDYSWEINGQNVKSGKPSDIQLEINENQGCIPEERINEVKTSENEEVVELDLSHSGDLNLMAAINYNIGEEFADKSAKLYMYSSEYDIMNELEDVTVDENGKINISIDEAVSYALVVDMTEPVAEEIVNIPEEAVKAPEEVAEATVTDVPEVIIPETEVTVEETTADVTIENITDVKNEIEIVKGDINNDGKIELLDLTAVSLYLLGGREFSEPQLNSADVNSDNKVDLADMALIRQYIVKDITSFNF